MIRVPCGASDAKQEMHRATFMACVTQVQQIQLGEDVIFAPSLESEFMERFAPEGEGDEEDEERLGG